MENADKVITAYSGLSIPQAIILGCLLVIVVGTVAWLVASYGISFKSLTIGGSKKVLDASRHDAFLKEDLRSAIDKIDQDLAVDLRFCAKRRKHDFIKSLNVSCFFAGFTMGCVFEEILVAYYARSDFIQKLSRGNRQPLIDIITNKMFDEYQDNEFRLKSSPCSVAFPVLQNSEKIIKDIVNDFFEEALILCEGALEKKIKTYEENENLFKDPFFKENACVKKIKETRSLLESIQ